MWLESSLELPDSLHLENKVDSSDIWSKSFASDIAEGASRHFHRVLLIQTTHTFALSL